MFLWRLADLDIGDIFDNIMPRLKEVGVQLIATSIALFFLYKFLWKPMRMMLAKRQEYVISTIADAEKNQALAAENYAKSDQVLNEAYQKSKKTIDDAKISADLAGSKILASAEEERRNRLQQTAKQIESETQKARLELEKDIVNLSLSVAEKILEKEISTVDNQKIIERYIKDLNHD